jgi:hypothetical protein
MATWAAAWLMVGCGQRDSARTDSGDAGLPPPPPVAEAGAGDAAADARAAADASSDLDASDAGTDGGDPTDASAEGDGDDLGIDCTSDADHPVQLGCTGLYANWPNKTIAADVRPYTPGVALWSDGAEKHRWIRLPPNTQIDTSNMDEWTFPVGTKLWKEFSFGGQPVETRLLWKTAPGTWLRTTYLWSADETSATEVTSGVQNVDGGTYEVPSQKMCNECHEGRLDGVLGFEAVGLAAPGAQGLTLAELVKEGLLTHPPAGTIAVPGDPTTSAALGWLHANCGTACHNRSPNAYAGDTGLFMRLDVATLGDPTQTDTWTTAVGQPSNFQPYPDAGMLLVDPGNPDNSAVYFRADFRDDQGQQFQMPPIDTHVVPDAGVALVRAWIDEIKP